MKSLKLFRIKMGLAMILHELKPSTIYGELKLKMARRNLQKCFKATSKSVAKLQKL